MQAIYTRRRLLGILIQWVAANTLAWGFTRFAVETHSDKPGETYAN